MLCFFLASANMEQMNEDTSDEEVLIGQNLILYLIIIIMIRL